MNTLIDWRNLESKVESHIKNWGYENRSQALSHVLLETLFDLDPEEIGDAITDGPHDRGIDAVYIEEQENITVHLFQFKYTRKFEKSNDNFPSNEIDKMLSFIADMLSKVAAMKTNCNALVWSKVQSVWDILDREVPQFVVHLCGNMGELTTNELERFKTSLQPYRNFQIKQYSLKSLVSLIIEKKVKPTNNEVRLIDKQYFERVDGNIRGLIATLPALELIKLIQDPDDPEKVLLDVFNDNVRVYLGAKKNTINQKIFESALKQSAEFWYLNNGITITCDSFEYAPSTRSPLLKLVNYQIVNGGQTSNALFEAHKADKEKLDNVLVLVRIYETKKREISQRIAESTNSQTPIKSRDLHSNDDIQKKLEDEFLAMGYFYERKTDQHKDQEKKKRIDALVAGQVSLAYYIAFPEVAKKDRGRVFGDLYDLIFNSNMTAKKLLTVMEIFAPIEEQKRELQSLMRKNKPVTDKQLIILDGNYHILYAISLLCKHRDLKDPSSSDALSLMDEAVEIVYKVTQKAEKKFKEKSAPFLLLTFFKDGDTKSLIQQEVMSKPV